LFLQAAQAVYIGVNCRVLTHLRQKSANMPTQNPMRT